MKKVSLIFILLIGFGCISYAQTVTIGAHVWMTKNLDVSTFRNGDPIPQAKTKEEWKKAGLNKQAAWCYYENDASNGTKYGKLYNWYAVVDVRGLAPQGYHIPSNQEWTILTDYLGGEEAAGTKMKSVSGWESSTSGLSGSNSSKFSGLPGGYRGHDGTFYDVGEAGILWSSSEYDEAYGAWYHNLDFDDYSIGGYFFKEKGYSVRCLRD